MSSNATTLEPTKPTTKSNEWYTPSYLIEAARATMGSIDLDPASCAAANETVKATRYFTKEDDGLTKDWQGNVWLNPPFSYEDMPRGMESGARRTSIAGLWIDHLIAEYRAGNVTQAVLLVKSDTKHRWFQPLLDFPLCFTAKRVHFTRPGLVDETFQFGTCLVYLGPHEQRFLDAFSQYGAIVRRIA